MTKSKVKSRKARKARKSRKSPLSRWFQEKWINVCDLPKITPCGRKKSAPGKYPYCRPLYRVDAKTPRTVREVGRKVLKSRCRKKRSNPKRRVR